MVLKSFYGKMVIATLFFAISFSSCIKNDEQVYSEPKYGGANEEYVAAVEESFSSENPQMYDESMPPGEYDENSSGYETSESPNELTDQMSLDRKLIKNAAISFETDSLSKRKKIVDAAVKQFSAYIEYEEQYTSYGSENITTTIRVPAKNFDAFMEAITIGIGKFDSKNIQVDDVTEEFIDVEARISTKKELKLRFIKLLDKAVSIGEIMEIERQITALQGEIESYQGRLKYLSGNMKFATINLSYYRTVDVPVEFDNKFSNAFTDGWQGMIWFFVGLLTIWPFLILLIITLVILRIKLRKRKS